MCNPPPPKKEKKKKSHLRYRRREASCLSNHRSKDLAVARLVLESYLGIQVASLCERRGADLLRRTIDTSVACGLCR